MEGNYSLLTFTKKINHIHLGNFLNSVLFCIESGEVIIEIPEGPNLLLKKDNWISGEELALIGMQHIVLKARTMEVKMFAFPRDYIMARQNEDTVIFRNRNIVHTILNSHKLLAKIKNQTMNNLVNRFLFSDHHAGYNLCSKDHYMSQLHIIISGEVASNSTTWNIGTILFGDAIVEDSIPLTIQAKEDIKCIGECTIACISLYHLNQLIKTDVRDILEEKKRVSTLKDNYKWDSIVELENIQKVMNLGKDHLGEDFIVKIKDTNYLFVARVLERETIEQTNFQVQLLVKVS